MSKLTARPFVLAVGRQEVVAIPVVKSVIWLAIVRILIPSPMCGGRASREVDMVQDFVVVMSATIVPLPAINVVDRTITHAIARLRP